MTGLAPVVVGVDGSSYSELALDWAIEEARLRHLGITVVCAWRTPLLVAGPASAIAVPQVARVASHHADDIVRSAVRKVERAGVAVTGEVAEGQPAEMLLAMSDADQVVVGDRGAGAVSRFLVGSVSSAVAHHAKVPVTVVRASAGRERAVGQVVVGVDGSEHAQRALARAALEAAARQARLVVVGAWRITDPDLLAPFTGMRMPPMDDVEAQARARVDHAVATTLGAAADLTVSIVHDTPVDALIAAAGQADLLVVGTRGLGAFDRMLMGSVSTACLHHSPCPVQIVP